MLPRTSRGGSRSSGFTSPELRLARAPPPLLSQRAELRTKPIDQRSVESTSLVAAAGVAVGTIVNGDHIARAVVDAVDSGSTLTRLGVDVIKEPVGIGPYGPRTGLPHAEQRRIGEGHSGGALSRIAVDVM